LRSPTRRDGLIWLAGATAAVTGLAIAGPSLVGGGAAADAPAKDGSDSVILSAMQRDLDISRDDATTRLTRQKWAGSTERMLAGVLGDDFGGAWLGADGRQFTVAVTTKAAAAKVEAAGATPKLVTYAADTLDGYKADLDAATRATSTKRADSRIAAWYVDPKSNSVTVVAKPGGTAAAEKLAADLPDRAVRVVTSDISPKPLIDLRGGDPYFIDNQFRCSIGFSVEGGFVTAGHCGAVGSTTTDADGVAQGTVRVSTFPGDGDFGFVETNADFVPQPVVASLPDGVDGGEVAVPVAGGEEAPVGAAVCRTGSTTGTFCGVIEAKNITVNYPEGAVSGLTQTDVCAEGGDSGGSWLSGDQAQGVTSGGSGNCTTGGVTFFQPLTEILEAADVTLVTTGGAGGEPPVEEPPATEPPATEEPVDPAACEQLDAVANGSLDGTGDRQVVPSDGFFRAGQGSQEACLSAPAGADFDVALQQWTGVRWRTVASAASAGAGSTESLTFDGAGAFYRYVVTSTEGSGDFELQVGLP
jgi:streptogrisin C